VADLRPVSHSGYSTPSISLDKCGSGLARRDLAVVQKHEVNVAVRVQFRAAVTADGDERERRKLLCACGDKLLRAASQRCRNSASRIAARAWQISRPAHARAMLQFEPVRLDLEEAFVACEPFRRVAVRAVTAAAPWHQLQFF